MRPIHQAVLLYSKLGLVQVVRKSPLVVATQILCRSRLIMLTSLPGCGVNKWLERLDPEP